MSLRVLMSLEQQVDQPRYGPRLPQRRLIGGAQRQVPDQSNGGLAEGRGGGRGQTGDQRDSRSMWVILTFIRLCGYCPWIWYSNFDVLYTGLEIWCADFSPSGHCRYCSKKSAMGTVSESIVALKECSVHSGPRRAVINHRTCLDLL